MPEVGQSGGSSETKANTFRIACQTLVVIPVAGVGLMWKMRSLGLFSEGIRLQSQWIVLVFMSLYIRG